MEIVLLIIIISLLISLIIVLIKYFHLKQDIRQFSNQLEKCLDNLIAAKTINETADNDDLWSKIAFKLKRLSNIYQHSQQEIQDEREQLEQLISNISHQTKTPMANIKLYFELLKKENDPAKQQNWIKQIETQINKLEFLIQSMIKMSRLETGTIKIIKQPNLIIKTLTLALNQIIYKADQKQIKIVVNCDESIQCLHDSKWTSEAIFNLLDNAVKYTKEGGMIKIDVKVQPFFTKISIEDTGKGIAPKRQGAIFTRFYREPEVHDIDGIGIGLYLAREIITLQNGYIEVKSQVGQGSIFMIYLPNWN